MTVTALVLAGVRPGKDALAEFAGVSHKALIPVGGVAMLDRVVNALRASGRVPNYFGLQIDRLTPVPGVLDYDRDKIIDVKAQRPAG